MTKTTKGPDDSYKLEFSGALHCAVSAKSKRYFARFVRAGQVIGGNRKPTGITIAPDALLIAAPAGLFENKAVFLDHAGWFDYPSLNNLVGTTSNTTYNATDESIQGEIRLFETPAGNLAEKLVDELLEHPGKVPDIGLSLVFYPKWDKEHETIIGINHVESVDLVFQPAADGRILQALSTFHQQSIHNPRKESETMPETTVTTPVGADGVRPTLHPESVGAQGLRPDPEQNHPVLDAWIGAVAETATASVIAASNLPPASKERLAQGKYAHPDHLHAAIEAEREYLAKLSQDQVINVGGVAPRSPQITGMMNNLDRLQLALEAMLSGTRPPHNIAPLSGIRELYHQLSGDYEMSGVFQGDRIQFANVNSSTMASMVANALNKIVMAEFHEYPRWWEPFATLVDFASLQAVRWSVLGGVGELPTVAEGAAYTELTWDDKYESSAFIKKGGYLGLTIEAIDKDDTGRLRNAPRALAQAAWLTLSKSISSIFTQTSGVGPTLIDGLALFHATHANLGTTALSMAAYNVIRTAMRKQTELNSGERLGALCSPKFLLVPPDLEITALQILASEFDYTYALSNAPAAPNNVNADGDGLKERMTFARSRVIVVDLWTDTNDYACVADPRLYPSIGVGFRYGRSPEVFSVASPTAGLMFTNDTLPIKVRFVYAAGPIDYRGLYKANV